MRTLNYEHCVPLIELDGAASGADAGPGSRAQYLLDVDVADLVPPRVAGVTGLPSDGATIAEPVGPSFTVTLSEALDPATVNAGQRPVWSYGGHWYALSNASSWTGAETEAQALGGHLATIDDAAENQWVRDAFRRFGVNTWIGLSDQAVENTWAWAGGTALSYTNWASGQPNNNATNDYVYLGPSDGLWRVTSDTGLGTSARGIIEFTGADGDGDGVPDGLDAYPSDPFNNWSLRGAGADGVFDTADDALYRLTLATPYTGGTTVQFTIEGGALGAPASLGDGLYRFTANATLTDVVGNTLDGNGDGTGGDRYSRSFTVALPAGTTFEGENNDTLTRATDLPLEEDPSGSGYAVGRGIGRQDPATYWSLLQRPGLLAGGAAGGRRGERERGHAGEHGEPVRGAAQRRGSDGRGQQRQRSGPGCVHQPLRGAGERQLLRRGGQGLLHDAGGQLRAAGGPRARHPARDRRRLPERQPSAAPMR